MNRATFTNLPAVAFFAIALTTTSLAAAAEFSDRDSKVVESFVGHVDTLGEVTEEVRSNARTTVKELAEQPTDALTEGLAIIYPDYASAIEASYDDVEKSINLLIPMADSKDPFLAADANFYLARTLMNAERFEEALPRLEKLTRELVEFTVNQGDAQYYKGVAQAGMLQNQDAIQSFMEFLQFNPDAAERLRVSAWRQVQQLQAIEAGKLSDVYHHMDFSRRRLELTETGESTQREQDEIVKMLAALIKQQEKKECNSSCKKGGKNKDGKPKSSGEKPKQEPGESKSQSGGSSSNPNGKVVKKSYDDSPASPWSRLRDRSRDPANNAIKEKLPARYRDIVEKYYEAANGDGKK
jgi:tetratricopeptide (TPR) repeat protein